MKKTAKDFTLSLLMCISLIMIYLLITTIK